MCRPQIVENTKRRAIPHESSVVLRRSLVEAEDDVVTVDGEAHLLGSSTALYVFSLNIYLHIRSTQERIDCGKYVRVLTGGYRYGKYTS